MLEKTLLLLVIMVCLFMLGGGNELIRSWYVHRKWKKRLDSVTLDNAIRAQAFHNDVEAFRKEFIAPVEQELLLTNDPEKIVMLSHRKQDLEIHVQTWAKDAMLRSLYAVRDCDPTHKHQ